MNKGGRPKSPTLNELRQQIAARDKKEIVGGLATDGNSLKVLKRLYKLRNLNIGGG